MGRPKPEPGSSIRHFSHHHPLQNSSDPQDRVSCCAACKLKLAGLSSYSCRACGFHLHERCAELPQKIRHPFDRTHLLNLVPKPQYEEGRFRCDACGKDGDGFSYHCGDCGIDLHTVCANMPSRVSHHSHPQHELYLTFVVDDISGSFRCMICQGMGSNSWLYQCKECGFDAHLICARKRIAQTSRASPNPSPNINNNIIQTRTASPQVVSNLNPNPMRRPGLMNAGTTSTTVNQIISTALGIPRPAQIMIQHLMRNNGQGFDPSSIQGFDPSTLSGLDFSNLAGFDPSVFAGIDPSVLAGAFGGLGLS